MAIRIVTMDKLNEYINDTLGKEYVYVKKENSIEFVPKKGIPFFKKPVCILEKENVSGFEQQIPYLKFRDQVLGVLKVKGNIVSEDSIKPYTFFLEI